MLIKQLADKSLGKLQAELLLSSIDNTASSKTNSTKEQPKDVQLNRVEQSLDNERGLFEVVH